MSTDPLPPVGNLVGKMLDEGVRAAQKSKAAVAREIGVSASRISDIISGRRAITPEMALRLGRYFNTTPEYWLGIQMRCELDRLRLEKGTEIEREVQPVEMPTLT